MRPIPPKLREKPMEWEKDLIQSLQKVREGKGKEPFPVPSLWPSQEELIAIGEALKREGYPSLGQLVKALSSTTFLFDHFVVLKGDLLSPPNYVSDFIYLIDGEGDYMNLYYSHHLSSLSCCPMKEHRLSFQYYLKGFSLLPLPTLHARRLYTFFPAILKKDGMLRRYKALSYSFTHFMKALQRVELYLLLRRGLGELSKEGEEALRSIPSLKWKAADRFIESLREAVGEEEKPLPRWRATSSLFSYYGLLFLMVGTRWRIEDPLGKPFSEEIDLPKSLCLCEGPPNHFISYFRYYLHPEFTSPFPSLGERISLLGTL